MNLMQSDKDAMTTCGIPSYMQDSIINYYENGLYPGGFLSAVINNDLQESIGRADNTNIHCIKNYIMWFYNHAPNGTWGYQTAVEDWIERFKKEGEEHAI